MIFQIILMIIVFSTFTIPAFAENETINWINVRQKTVKIFATSADELFERFFIILVV